MVWFYLITLRKSIYFKKNEIEVNLSQAKIDFINDAYQKKLKYWTESSLKKSSAENEVKELTDLAPLRV